MKAKKIFSLIKMGRIDFIDLRFTDLRGVWQHTSIPAHRFNEENIQKGFGFDGSSIKGFASIYESDLILKPDITTLFIDPFFEKTAVVLCDVYDPEKDCFFEKDPRSTAKKAEEYLKKRGIADQSFWGPETEFFVFEKLATHLSPYFSSIEVKQKELPNGDGIVGDELDGYKILNKSGYFPVPPFDKLQSFRSEMVKILMGLEIEVEVHHHEVSAGGQVEVDLRYDGLVAMADKVMIYKYIARNLAKKYGMTACFLPKPIYGDNGSGMHTHQSLFKKSNNIFYDEKGYGELSKLGLFYISGLLTNVETLLAFTNPTINSYRRLVPHFEAPTAIGFSKRNRSASIRIPMYFKRSPLSKRIEFRCPDPTANPYLSFAAQLIFGLKGIEEKLDPTHLGFGPYDENIWENDQIRQIPGQLSTVLAALVKDKILVGSEVFSPALIKSYLEIKKEEAQQNQLYPTPADFWFYSDI